MLGRSHPFEFFGEIPIFIDEVDHPNPGEGDLPATFELQDKPGARNVDDFADDPVSAVEKNSLLAALEILGTSERPGAQKGKSKEKQDKKSFSNLEPPAL
jgi:hypothetical protein